MPSKSCVIAATLRVQPAARAVRRHVDVLADVRPVEVEDIGAALAFDRVAAVARIPLERVGAPAQQRRVGADVAVERSLPSRRAAGPRSRCRGRCRRPRPPSSVRSARQRGRSGRRSCRRRRGRTTKSSVAAPTAARRCATATTLSVNGRRRSCRPRWCLVDRAVDAGRRRSALTLTGPSSPTPPLIVSSPPRRVDVDRVGRLTARHVRLGGQAVDEDPAAPRARP